MSKYLVWLIVAIIIGGAWLLLGNNGGGSNELKIGVLNPLTGPAATFGQQVQNGVDLAQAALASQGTSVKVTSEDDKCTGTDALNAYEKLVGVDGVKAILGSFCSAATLAVAPRAMQDKVVVLTPGASAEDISSAGEYIFRDNVHTSTVMQKLAGYAAVKYKSVAIFYDKGQDPAVADNKYFTQFFTAAGGTIAASIGVDGKAADFRTEVTKAKAQAPGAQAVFMSAFEPTVEAVMKATKELGYVRPLLLTNTVVAQPSFVKNEGKDAEGAVYADVAFDTSAAPAFASAYQAKFNKTPTLIAAQAYDGFMLLVQAAQQCKSDTSCMKDSLHSVKDYPGAAGMTTFDSHGDAIKTIVLKTIQNGQFIPLTQ